MFGLDELVFLVIGDWGDSFYWDPESPHMQVAAGTSSQHPSNISLLPIQFVLIVFSMHCVATASMTSRVFIVAAMNDWAATNNPQFIVTTGDNFYPHGVRVRLVHTYK